MSHVRGHIDGVNDEAYGVTSSPPPTTPPPGSNQSILDPAAQQAFAAGLAY